MTKRIFTLSLMMFAVLAVMAQGMVKGRVLDKANDEALGFVNIAVSPKGSKTIAGGATTDIDGKFSIKNLKNGDYTLTLTFVGYKTVTKEFQISDNHKTVSYAALHMAEDANVLSEVKVVGQRSAMKLEVDRKTFDVSSNLANAGETASEVLDNIPSVEVDNDGNVSLRGNNSVEVWINGRSAGLTSDNMGQVLQQIPAESIDRSVTTLCNNYHDISKDEIDKQVDNIERKSDMLVELLNHMAHFTDAETGKEANHD